MSAQTFLDRLQRVKESGHGRGLAACPGPLHEHGDRNRSLSWRIVDGERLLFHCFAGCDPGEILGAMGLTFADVMPQREGESASNRSWIPAAEILEAVDHEVFTAWLILDGVVRRRKIKPEELKRLTDCARAIGAARDRVRPAKVSRSAA